VGTSRSTDPRPRRREAGFRAGLSVAGAVLIFAAGGCAGEERLSKPDYEQTVRGAYAEVEAAFRSTRGVALDKLAPRVETAQKQLRGAADRLEGVEPPKEVEEQNDELAEGMRDYAKNLDEVREAADRGDRAGLARFNAELVDNSAVERIAEAAEEMKFKGYDLGAIAAE
jgi:hypothetical protein